MPNQSNRNEWIRANVWAWHGWVAASAAIALAACSGQIGQAGGVGPIGGGGTGGTGVGPGKSAGPAACQQGASLAPARLSLISDDQYRNIVHDVFGVTFPAATNVTSPPSKTGSYPYDESANLQATTVQEYQRAADIVASLVTSMPPCTMGAVNAACMETYLRNTLPRAWRRPVTDSEIVGLMGIFSMASGETRQTQLTMEAALIHPAFLFRTEIGNDAATATGKVQLTPYELASAVSFAVLNSVPDAGLWAKAQDGSLTQSAVLAPR